MEKDGRIGRKAQTPRRSWNVAACGENVVRGEGKDTCEGLPGSCAAPVLEEEEEDRREG